MSNFFASCGHFFVINVFGQLSPYIHNPHTLCASTSSFEKLILIEFSNKFNFVWPLHVRHERICKNMQVHFALCTLTNVLQWPLKRRHKSIKHLSEVQCERIWRSGLGRYWCSGLVVPRWHRGTHRLPMAHRRPRARGRKCTQSRGPAFPERCQRGFKDQPTQKPTDS